MNGYEEIIIAVLAAVSIGSGSLLIYTGVKVIYLGFDMFRFLVTNL